MRGGRWKQLLACAYTSVEIEMPMVIGETEQHTTGFSVHVAKIRGVFSYYEFLDM